MALTPEQKQMLQYYMQKNRAQPMAVQAPQLPSLPQSDSGGGGLSSMLSSLGSYFDTPAQQGPVRPGDAPLQGAQPSFLSRFANTLDPNLVLQKQIAQAQAPKIDIQQIIAALQKAGIR